MNAIQPCLSIKPLFYIFHPFCVTFRILCVKQDRISKLILFIWQGRGRAFSLLLQVQSGREIAGDGEAEGNIMKKVFEAAGSSSVSDRFSCVRERNSRWLRQQWGRFPEFDSPGEAQQIGRLDSALSSSSWRQGFTDMSGAIKQKSCLWY